MQGRFHVSVSVSPYPYSLSVSNRLVILCSCSWHSYEMTGNLLTVSASKKVTEHVRQHPVLYVQHRQDYRDSAIAASIWKSIAKVLEEDFSDMYLQIIEVSLQISSTCFPFCF